MSDSIEVEYDNKHKDNKIKSKINNINNSVNKILKLISDNDIIKENK